MSATKNRVTRAISPPASPGRYEDSSVHSSTASPPRKRGRQEDDIDDSDSE